MTDRARWCVVFVYAAAMAWVEAAVVLYLRTMLHRLQPFQAHPLPVIGGLAQIEIAREAATLVMLLAVGLLAGRNWRSRLGYAAVAFGVWDIFYYVFLKAMCGWPHGLMDWDVLFLIPLPWWGPVLAPMLIALLMILWGTLASQFESGDAPPIMSRLVSTAFAGLGILLALGVFMADALAAAPRGAEAVREVLPTAFHWPMFCGALLLMSVPVVYLVLALARRRQPG